jgi:ribokinase
MIIVFGSINIDLVVRVHDFPRPGETVRGEDLIASPGGKGANQALAARRMGANVALVGSVGKDPFADIALSLLREAGVDIAGVAIRNNSTGAALIVVDHRAENQITLSPGANADTEAGALSKLRTTPGDIFLVQRELREEFTLEGLRWAKSRGLYGILNAAPAAGLNAAFFAVCDMLITNEQEAATIASTFGLPEDPASFAAEVAQRHGICVVVTLGARGAVAHDGAASFQIEAFPVNPVDTTGAGDAFVGALAAFMGEGMCLPDSLARAVAAGSLACQRVGAQASVPGRAEVEAFLDARGAVLHRKQ